MSLKGRKIKLAGKCFSLFILFLAEDGETLEPEVPLLADDSDDEEYTDQVSML